MILQRFVGRTREALLIQHPPSAHRDDLIGHSIDTGVEKPNVVDNQQHEIAIFQIAAAWRLSFAHHL
jgi:hypothetical protein